ncbi:serine/threonine-protein kinase pim-1-like [Clarias gariepinus]|uniref:serine/threonine-protein kinase pim-1-like n=1 Tax=Clarias gariepinus TaxID=13013 RepID=UPI00234E0F47|nr:serine/threonine-protein kinase pim-1-like [Clarias gariepinus]
MLPLEVALMELVSRPPLCENVVELLDWFDSSTFYILVVERPNPCMHLHEFCKLHNSRLPESVAQKVMQQVVRVALHCCEHRVLHYDFKQDLLINPDTLDVKLVDFGCGELMTDELFTDFTANPACSPPECIQNSKNFGFFPIIWGLGILLYELVCGELPFANEVDLVKGHLSFVPGLSDECCNLIQRCLNQDPKCQPTLKEILNHKWFKEHLQDTAMLVIEGGDEHPCGTGESNVLQLDERFSSADDPVEASSSVSEIHDVDLKKFHPSQHNTPTHPFVPGDTVLVKILNPREVGDAVYSTPTTVIAVTRTAVLTDSQPQWIHTSCVKKAPQTTLTT